MLAPENGSDHITFSTRQDWLSKLVALSSTDHHEPEQPLDDTHRRDIDSCYQYCARITAFHSKSFFMASGLLPIEKRNAARALYAFCRTTDDIIDLSDGRDARLLERWKRDIEIEALRFNDPVAIAWAHTRSLYNIPTLYGDQLIDGVRMDLDKKTYGSFDELSEYCYKVASTVGLMSMHIIGYTSETAVRYAIELGVALQMTNILRDIAEDYARGRVYLPRDEMEAFSVSRDHLEHGIVDSAWKNFMAFQVERARQLYERAWPGIQLLDSDGRLAIGAAATFYRQILAKIEANNFDVFSQRAYVTKWGKIRQLPDLYFKFKYANTLNSLLS